MLQSKTKTIDGHVFIVTQLPGMASLTMFRRLVALLGPSIEKLMPALNVKNVAELDVGAIVQAITSLFQRMTDEELESVMWKLLYSCAMDGQPFKPEVLDVQLAGKVSTVFKLLAFALEVNYNDFFGDLVKAGGTPLAAMLAAEGKGGQ